MNRFHMSNVMIPTGELLLTSNNSAEMRPQVGVLRANVTVDVPLSCRGGRTILLGAREAATGFTV